VFIVDNPEEWAAVINQFIADATGRSMAA